MKEFWINVYYFDGMHWFGAPHKVKAACVAGCDRHLVAYRLRIVLK